MPRKPDPDMPEIAARLREARARVFATAADAARALDMKPVTVRAHESGQNGVGSRDLERYARRYGVNLGWLLVGEGALSPKASEFFEVGEPLDISGTLQDGVWLSDPPERWEYASIAPTTSAGLEEAVVYADPRFPVEMVRAFKVISSAPNGIYDGSCVVFAVPRHEIGIRSGDHVIAYIERGDFTQATLRRYVARDAAVVLEALTSGEGPLSYKGDLSDGVDVVAVVIGAQVRRDVNLPSRDALAVSEATRRGPR